MVDYHLFVCLFIYLFIYYLRFLYHADESLD